MNIIFGDKRHLVPDNYTVLELDTIRRPPDYNANQVYCLLTEIPLHELPVLPEQLAQHSAMLELYRSQHWDACEDLIENQLRGRWNGEVDSFYDELLARMQKFRDHPPASDWDGSLTVA